ncbi:hypothetical protein N657DRAFT_477608 [Parathielavia appendiculata]|uniref:Uncharacterized protein n=1 Tax=Parathielavia appendiculata TaxID=2587402 RepID=A0AAN6TY91_9PEZI|nr:hypothetical protein N657DRAFT_477608 [Parathielavia appendiculata]
MGRLPNELYGMTYAGVALRTFGHRRGILGTICLSPGTHTTTRPKSFESNLCTLRLVHKGFRVPATKYLLSHGFFSFDSIYLGSTGMKKRIRALSRHDIHGAAAALAGRIEYCMSNADQEVMARTSDLRMDLDLLNRHLQLLDQRRSDGSSATLGQITDGEQVATDQLATPLTARFKSVTALEVRNDRPQVSRIYGNDRPALALRGLRCRLYETGPYWTRGPLHPGRGSCQAVLSDSTPGSFLRG